MSLVSVLTLGWEQPPADAVTAVSLHQGASGANEYTAAVERALRPKAPFVDVLALDRLFRKRTGGFDQVKQLVGALAAIDGGSEEFDTIRCYVDVFAYAFLRGAKNFDFLLPEAPDVRGSYRSGEQDLLQRVAALEAFERDGTPLPPNLHLSREDYLALRAVLTKPLARDERRTLAAFLVSGPSTLEEISMDLGLNYTLSQRVLGAFEPCHLFDRTEDGRYRIRAEALPMVVFGLRETLGLDYLSWLE